MAAINDAAFAYICSAGVVAVRAFRIATFYAFYGFFQAHFIAIADPQLPVLAFIGVANGTSCSGSVATELALVTIVGVDASPGCCVATVLTADLLSP